MTTLSRITLATILMGSLAMPVLAQSNAAPGVAGTPTTATKTAPQTNAANPVKSLHKTECHEAGHHPSCRCHHRGGPRQDGSGKERRGQGRHEGHGRHDRHAAHELNHADRRIGIKCRSG
jgi:hypothetical protein